MGDFILRTTSPLMDVRDEASGMTYSIHRCDECGALTLGVEDEGKHLTWHDELDKRIGKK